MTEHDDFKPHDLGYIAYGAIIQELRFLGDYLETVVGYIDNVVKEVAAEEKPSDSEGHLSSSSSTWEFNIVQQVRVSFIMLLFSVFEKNINRFCSAVAEKKRLPIERKDIAGGILASSKKYLEVFGNFNFKYIEGWNLIEGLYDVRNIFVHGGGNKNKARLGTERRLNKLLKSDIGLSKDNNRITITNDEFCYFALESINDLFQELINQYRDNLGAGLEVIK